MLNEYRPKRNSHDSFWCTLPTTKFHQSLFSNFSYALDGTEINRSERVTSMQTTLLKGTLPINHLVCSKKMYQCNQKHWIFLQICYPGLEACLLIFTPLSWQRYCHSCLHHVRLSGRGMSRCNKLTPLNLRNVLEQ